MIDIESEVFDTVYDYAIDKHPKLNMSSEMLSKPTTFPFASLIEMDNTVYRNSIESSRTEVHAYVMYQVEVFSNKTKGRKSECKSIMSTIDERMHQLGFTRIMCEPVMNEDASLYRMIARYRALVDNNHTIYRR